MTLSCPLLVVLVTVSLSPYQSSGAILRGQLPYPGTWASASQRLTRRLGLRRYGCRVPLETPPEATGDGRVAQPVAEAAPELAPHRLEAFSDGVMAVIITIMAFEIKAPATSGFKDLRHQMPALLVYALSFVIIGIYWNNHHHLLRSTPRIDGAVMWSNLALLFWLSLVPVETEWVANQYRHPLPAASYGVALLGAAIAYFVLVKMIIRANPGSHVAEAIGTDFKGAASAFVYLAAIGLAALAPWISYSLYALVAVSWFVPDRRLVRTKEQPA